MKSSKEKEFKNEDLNEDIKIVPQHFEENDFKSNNDEKLLEKTKDITLENENISNLEETINIEEETTNIENSKETIEESNDDSLEINLVEPKVINETMTIKILKNDINAHMDLVELKKFTDEQRMEIEDKEVLVNLSNVDISFGHKKNIVHAVKNLSLNIYKGEVLGLVGESGSGKSTVGNSIMGLVNRQSGSISIKGTEIPFSTKKVKGKIHKFLVNTAQMIFQDPASSLNPYKKLFKIVAEGLKNVDSIQIFAKMFDSITASTLSSILRGVDQPKEVEKLSVSWINDQIDNANFEEVKYILYELCVNQLESEVNIVWDTAATYLKMRKDIRNKFLNSRKVKKKKIIKKLVEDIVESVGIPDGMLKRYPLELSGGQQQRIGISRAVVLKPDLIVADEPISALDVSIQAQVINIFNDLKEKLGLTILFIAHDLRMVEYISDRIAVMHKGVLVEIGDAHEIIQNPIHPYTRTIIEAIPTIDKLNKSLRSKKYNPDVHNYDDENYPEWFNVAINGKKDKKHFVFATEKELIKWLGGDYEK